MAFAAPAFGLAGLAANKLFKGNKDKDKSQGSSLVTEGYNSGPRSMLGRGY